MTTHHVDLLPESAQGPTNGQRMFARYFTGTLIDLVVLNLFAEYSSKVFVDSFTTSLLAAIVLQLLLKLTIGVEHWVLGFFKGKTGGLMTFLKYFSAWVVLFGSKFVILEAIVQLFGDNVRFEGRFDGIITLIIVVVVMLVAEEVVARIYRKLS